MIALAVTLIIDTSFVKINDLVNKYIIPMDSKLILFSIISSICLFLQLLAIRFVMNSFGSDRFKNTPKVRAIYLISLTSFFVLTFFIGLLAYELFHHHYYEIWINVVIVSISYGASSVLIIWLALIFFSWYKSSHDRVVFLYFVSMSLIAFHLILTGLFIGAKLNDNQYLVGEYVGSSGDVSGGRHQLLNDLYRISSFISFFGIWMTTAILMSSYREKLIGSLKYWIILILPLVYFLITYFYQFFLSNLLVSYFQTDPITVSIIVSAFLSLSKPIGGLIFAAAFWNMSRVVGYERKMKLSMVIAGWGIFFIFSANQAATQIVVPYPPFGITSVTVLNMASFLIVLGIFNSASLVSANNNLRSSLHKHASKLLKPIGRAEMEREIQKTVLKISEDKEIAKISGEEPFEFDKEELRKYLNEVIKVKRNHAS
jgi:MFS family permease